MHPRAVPYCTWSKVLQGEIAGLMNGDQILGDPVSTGNGRVLSLVLFLPDRICPHCARRVSFIYNRSDLLLKGKVFFVLSSSSTNTIQHNRDRDHFAWELAFDSGKKVHFYNAGVSRGTR